MAARKLGILVLLVLSMQACSDWFADEQHLMDKATGYLDVRNFSAAAIELRNVLQANPDNARARYLLAGINLDYGDFETAIKEFRHAEKAGWSVEEARIGIARSLLGMGRFEDLREVTQPDVSTTTSGRANLLALQAIAEAGLGNTERAGELAAQAAEQDPAALQVIKARVQLHMLAGQLDQARDILNAGARHYSDNQELLLVDATLRQRSGDGAGAVGRYQRVMELDPPGFISQYGRDARLQITQLQIIAGEYKLAETTLKPLFGRDPKDPLTNYLGGVLAFEQHDYTRAEQLLLKVLKLAPEHNPSRLLYGTVNFAEKNYEQAAYFLAKYLDAAPDNLEARKLLARTYILLDRTDEARAILKDAQSGQTDDAELLALVGLSDLARGKQRTGIAELKKALKRDTGSLPIRIELARAYIDAGETGLAMKELRSILADGGDQQQTGMLQVLANLRAGDSNEAIKLVLKMLHGHEDDPALQTLAGNVFAASGDFAEARRYLQRALVLKPDLPPAVLSLASLEERESNYPAATRLYQQLVDMNLKTTLPMLALARVAEQQGDNETMLDWLQRAVESAPDDNEPRLLLAEYYLHAGAIEKAWPLVKTALKKTPQAVEVLVMQARLLMAERKYGDALDVLNGLLSSDPDSVVAHTLLGECYLELTRYAEAREQLETALDTEPDSVPAMALLARLEIESGSSDHALELSKQIQTAYPEFYLGYELSGDTLTVRGDYKGAGREYAQARERLQQVDLVIKQAENASRSGNSAAAAGYLQEWLAEHPDDVRAMQFLGTTWQNMGMTDLAIKQYEQVLELDRENAVALNNLAGLYLQAGKPEATALAQRALKAAPDNPGVLDTYAWIQIRQGKTQEGLRLLEKVITQLPDNPEVRYHHAVAVLQAGDRERGERLLRALLNEAGAFVGRDEALRMLATSASQGPR